MSKQNIAKKETKIDFKDVHIIVPFAYLLSSYSKFEWAERGGTGAHKKAER